MSNWVLLQRRLDYALVEAEDPREALELGGQERAKVQGMANNREEFEKVAKRIADHHKVDLTVIAKGGGRK